MFSIVLSHTRWANTSKRHRLDKDIDVDLVHGSSAIREFPDESIYCFLITAKDKCGQWVWCRSDSGKRLIKCSVGEDREDGSKFLFFHDFIIPCDGIDNRRVDIMCIR